MKALITGGFGFAGRHLAQHLASCGDDVAVTYNPRCETIEQESLGFPLPKTAQSMALDVTEKQAVEQLLAVLQPDAVFHLAAYTFVPQAEEMFDEVYQTNTVGALNVLQAIQQHSRQTRFLYVSSAEVYGDPRPGSLPLSERAALRPVSVYGLSKAWADLAVFRISYRDNIHAVRVRPFPHLGPGQNELFAISSFARQIANIKLGRAEPQIMVGNLEAKRDYSDVSDIVRGYREALVNGTRSEVYNLCSGTSIEIGELLERLLKVAEVEAEIVVDPQRLRPVDIPDMYGDYSRAHQHFGWKPRIDLEGTLHSVFAYWLEELEKTPAQTK